MAEDFGRNVRATISGGDDKVEYYSDFRMTFNITRNADATKPDACTLNIYNLLDNVNFYFDDAYLTIEAGYQGNYGTVFKGNITGYEWGRTDNDVIISFDAGDGAKAVQSLTAKAYPPKTSEESIINDAVDQIEGVGTAIASGVKDFVKQIKAGKKIKLPKLFNASTIASMVKSLKTEGHTVSIIDNTLYIREEFQPTDEESIVVSSNPDLIGDTAQVLMIGSPKTGTKEFTTGSGKAKRTISKNTVTFSCHIHAGIHPARKIDLRSEFIEGYYVVDSMTVSGDTNANGSWMMTCEAIML